MTTLLCALKYELIMFLSNAKFILQSTSVSTAVTFVLFLAAIILIAIKCPAKLHSIGMIAIVWGVLCFAVAFVKVYDEFIFYFPDCSIHAYVYEKMLGQESFTLDDIRSIESIWKYIVSPLANAFTILLWSTLNYLISRILYIIRTPRI